jgi:hypothetical protein
MGGQDWLKPEDYRQPGESEYKAYQRLTSKLWTEAAEFMESVQQMYAKLNGRLLIEDLRKRDDYGSKYGGMSADASALQRWYNEQMSRRMLGDVSSGGMFLPCAYHFDQSDCTTSAYNGAAGNLWRSRRGWNLILGDFNRSLSQKAAMDAQHQASVQARERQAAEKQVIADKTDEWVAEAQQQQQAELDAYRRGALQETMAKTALAVVLIGIVGVGGYVGYRWLRS